MNILNKLKTAYKENRSLANNIVGVVLLKGLSLILSFVMTPLYLAYFSDQAVLGIWYTILSILTWILTFDLGIGNGLRNKLAQALTVGDRKEAKNLISSAYVVLGILSVGMIAVSVFVVPLLPWQSILNSTLHEQTLVVMTQVVIIGILLQFFFKIVTSVLYSLKKNVLANALGFFTNILIFVYLLLAPDTTDENKIIWLAAVYSVATIIPLLGATVYVFAAPLRDLRPHPRCFQKSSAKQVLSVGGVFFLIQLGLLVVNSTNQFLINNLVGNAAVVDYTVYYRLFSMATMIFTLFSQPVWSEISVRYAKGDLAWIRKIYFAMTALATVLVVGCLLVDGLLPWIFDIWLRDEYQPPADRSIGLLFVIWAAVELYVASASCVANGMTKLRCQSIFVVVAAVAKIPATYLCVKVFGTWESVVLAHTVVFLPLMIAQNISILRLLKKK